MPRTPRQAMEDMNPEYAPEAAPAPVSVPRTRNPFRIIGRRAKRRPVLAAIILIALLGILGTAYYYHQYKMLRDNPNAVQQEEVAKLVKEVSRLMLLPKETPTVATVLDTKALASQPFFTNAVNGDKVLVFVNARQAVLYRPSEDKIINVAPLFFQDDAGAGTGAAVEAPAATNDATDTDTTTTKTKATTTDEQ